MPQAPQGDSVFQKFFKKYGPRQAPQRQDNTNNDDEIDQTTGKKKVKATTPQNNQESTDPMELFKNMFDPPNEEEQKRKAPPAFNLTSEAISKAAAKMNFSDGLPPELADKLKNGYDPEAMMEAINHAGRTAYARALEHGTSITGKYIDIRHNHESQGLDEKFRKYLATKSFDGNSNGADNPVVRKHRERVAAELSERYPEATPSEIAELTDAYFVEVAKMVKPDAFHQGGNNTDGRNNTKGDGLDIQDWGAYLENKATGGQGNTGSPAAQK